MNVEDSILNRVVTGWESYALAFPVTRSQPMGDFIGQLSLPPSWKHQIQVDLLEKFTDVCTIFAKSAHIGPTPCKDTLFSSNMSPFLKSGVIFLNLTLNIFIYMFLCVLSKTEPGQWTSLGVWGRISRPQAVPSLYQHGLWSSALAQTFYGCV